MGNVVFGKEFDSPHLHQQAIYSSLRRAFNSLERKIILAEKKQGAVEILREKLNDSISLCKDPMEIVLEMSEIIGDLSGEKNFYRTLQEQISTNYGKVFKNKVAIDNEIKIVTERMKKIEAASQNPEFDDDERRRIIFALERHKKEIERLESLKNAETSQC